MKNYGVESSRNDDFFQKRPRLYRFIAKDCTLFVENAIIMDIDF
jgi:hypothetical protein